MANIDLEGPKVYNIGFPLTCPVVATDQRRPVTSDLIVVQRSPNLVENCMWATRALCQIFCGAGCCFEDGGG